MRAKRVNLFIITLLLSFENVWGTSDRILQENHVNFTPPGNTTGMINPTVAPTESPAPSPSPSAFPTYMPSIRPSSSPTKAPTVPSDSPTESPAPSPSPSQIPTMKPTQSPTPSPSASPSASQNPSSAPSGRPSIQPSLAPTRSQRPSSRMQPYSASAVEIVFEKIVQVLEMNEKDISLFESVTKEILQSDFSSLEVNEILFLKVEMKEQKIMPRRRNLRDLKSHQYADLAISFDVKALVNHDWNIPFDLKERMTTYFGSDKSVEKLRSNLEAEGATFLNEMKSKDATGSGDNLMPLGWIVGAIVGSLIIIAGIVVAYRRASASFHSKLSLASTGSNDEEEDESSDAQMIVAGQNIYGGNILSFPTPTGENDGVETSFFGSSRPAFLTMDSNIEIPDTPVGFTPQGSKTASSMLDTPNSTLGAQNTSTRSVGFRKFLMDTPPSTMNGNKKSSRGFFRPPRSAGPQRNLTPGKETIDLSPALDKSTIVDSDKVDFSPVKFPSDFNSNKIEQKHKLTPSTRDTKRNTSKLRLRTWPSGYFSDESSS